MLTAFENYRTAHEDLFLAESPEQFSSLAKTAVEQYIENRSIWEELNHFKANGKILGSHPIFHELIAFEALRKLNSSELSRKRTNLYINIQKTRKLITKGDKPELNLQREQSVLSKERLMLEIDKILKSR